MGYLCILSGMSRLLTFSLLLLPLVCPFLYHLDRMKLCHLYEGEIEGSLSWRGRDRFSNDTPIWLGFACFLL